MKKWFLLIFIAIIMAMLFLFPGEKTLMENFNTPIPVGAPTRLMTDRQNWNTWWPGEKINDSVFRIGDKAFVTGKILLNGFSVFSQKPNADILLNVQFLAAPGSQTNFRLYSTYKFSQNPIKRLIQYPDYLKWKSEFKTFANQLHDFYSDTKKVYGIQIEKKNVPDANHISIVQEYAEYPTLSEIYSLINELKTYVASRQGKVVNDPIMNIVFDEGKYKLMVAVATDRAIPSDNRFKLKQMFLGKLLVAEVKGGNIKISECQQQIENYNRDFGKAMPAIPFQRLITDRSMEKDSTKWITTINFPVYD